VPSLFFLGPKELIYKPMEMMITVSWDTDATKLKVIRQVVNFF